MTEARFSKYRLTTAHLTFVPLLTALAGCHMNHRASPVLVEPPGPLLVAPASSALTLDLAQCLQMAYERQPRVTTQRASLAAAEDADRALRNLRLPGNLDSQVPIRRQQSALGVKAAAAGVDRAERETAYGVVRTYYTVLYAREQERLARNVVEQLAVTKDNAQQAIDAGARDVSTADVTRTSVYLHLAETKQIEAAQGVKRALIALREAIGLGSEVTLDVPAGGMPNLEAHPDRKEIISAALMRRGDFIQATLFAQIACLEIDAQATTHAQRMQTFAAGSDIHSMQVPQGSNDTDYRPGGVLPEMPSLLVGSKAERIKHAETLRNRAQSLVETTRNLITLEAEDAFLRWEQASDQARKAKQAAEDGEKFATDRRKGRASGLKITVEEVVSSRVLASQAQSEFNEFLYKQIIALADLERISAGGFNAGFVGIVPTKQP